MGIFDNILTGFKALFDNNSNYGIGNFRSAAQIQNARVQEGIAAIRNRNQRIIDEMQPKGSKFEFENFQRPKLESAAIAPFNAEILNVQNIINSILGQKRPIGALDRSSANFLYKGQGSFRNLHPVSQANIFNISRNQEIERIAAPINAYQSNLVSIRNENQKRIDEIFNIVAPTESV